LAAGSASDPPRQIVTGLVPWLGHLQAPDLAGGATLVLAIVPPALCSRDARRDQASDADGDRVTRKRTLVVRLGRPRRADLCRRDARGLA
jgi:hypothetical protein